MEIMGPTYQSPLLSQMENLIYLILFSQMIKNQEKMGSLDIQITELEREK